ncbi:EthD domain-containing protein [Spirillospora sp. CA-255316]
MIKRIRCATRGRGVSAGEFAEAWPGMVAEAWQAPPDVRPSRVAVCTTVPGLEGAAPRHDGVGIEWFADAAHLRRFQGWLLESHEGRMLLRRAIELVEYRASPVVVAEECVMRGADWLDRRWRDGGARLKHMALALRAGGLTPAEFSERWRDHAGRVGRTGPAGAAVIPAEARGQAYVQNHPSPRTSGEWAYDAVNEVWFDDVEGLRKRIEWFRENLTAQGSEDLVRRSWFIAVREEVVPPA